MEKNGNLLIWLESLQYKQLYLMCEKDQRPTSTEVNYSLPRSWQTSRGCDIKFFTYTYHKIYFKTFQIEAKISLIKKVHLFFIRPNGPNFAAVKKCQNLTFKVTFWGFFENQFRRIGGHLTAILQVWWKKMHFLWSVKSLLQSKMFWNAFVK